MQRDDWPCVDDERFMRFAMRLWENRALFAYSKQVILHVPPERDFPQVIEFVPRSEHIRLCDKEEE